MILRLNTDYFVKYTYCSFLSTLIITYEVTYVDAKTKYYDTFLEDYGIKKGDFISCQD